MSERLERTLAAIAARDGRLGAFVHLDPVAPPSEEAATRGPLAGELVAVKDNIAVAGAPWACGSDSRRERPRDHGDAEVVRRLRRAGATIIGTTNLDEFAMGASTESSAWGPTRNPWDETRTAGGSSGGSAAAVAAYGVGAVGTDTGGSIREPAAFCGVVGVVPSPGSVPTAGVVDFAPTLDRVGPLAPDVAGAAALHEVMAGLPGTLTAAARRGRRERDLTGLTIGRIVPMSGERNDAGVLAAFDSGVRDLERLGAEVVDVSVPCFGDLLDVYLAVTSVEAIPVLRRHEGHGLGHEAHSRLEIGRRLSGTHELAEAHSLRRRISADAREVLTRCRLMVSPTVPLVAPPLGRQGMDDPLARPRTDWWTVEANLAGLAAMSLPIGSCAGLPVGLQLMAAPGDDAALYRVGAAIEAGVVLPGAAARASVRCVDSEAHRRAAPTRRRGPDQ